MGDVRIVGNGRPIYNEAVFVLPSYPVGLCEA